MNELFIKQLEELRDHAEKQSEIMEKMIKTVLKEDEEKPIESVTVDGEVYKVGDRFRFLSITRDIPNDKVCTITGFRADGRAIMDDSPNGSWSPWWTDYWQRVTEPAQPAWDGEFVPGEFYEVRGGLIILSDSVTYDGRHVGTVIIKATVIKPVEPYSVGQYVEIYGTGIFRPVKVNITVEE